MATLDRGLLAFLERRKAEASAPPAELPSRLPLNAIKRYESLFQPRALDKGHVTALASVLRSQADLTPMLVIQVGPDAVLIDGHHRRAAYEEVGGRETVPVVYFSGSVVEAIRQAGLENHRDKLRMSQAEKADFAWRLVLLERFSKAEEAAGSGMSPRTVARMRATVTNLKRHGEDPFRFSSWLAADMAARGLPGRPEPTDDEVQERLDSQADAYVDRLNREFGRRLADPETAARVLVRYVGRGAIPELVNALVDEAQLSQSEFDDPGAGEDEF